MSTYSKPIRIPSTMVPAAREAAEEAKFPDGGWREMLPDTEPLPEAISMDFGDNILGMTTMARTYCRRVDANNPKSRIESPEMVIERVLSATETQLNVHFTKDELREFRTYLHTFRGMVAGRFMWQLGSDTVDRIGLMSLQNCAGIDTTDPVLPFLWAADSLMLGSGVGYSLNQEQLDTFPSIHAVNAERKDVNDADFIVPDSREGWVEAIRALLEAHFVKKTPKWSYSCGLIRGRGEPIRKFGGVASGPDVLEEGLQRINAVLNKRAATTTPKMTTTDALDIYNAIGRMVVSGNVRRCLPADTLVHTRKGIYPIEEVTPGSEVLTTFGYKKVLRRYIQGEQTLITVNTENGPLRCTSNHRVCVFDPKTEEYGWCQAGDLKPNQLMVLNRATIEGEDQLMPGQEVAISSSQAWVIGYCFGAITTGKDNETYIRMPSARPEVHNIIYNTLLDMRDADDRLSDDYDMNRKDSNLTIIYSKALKQYLDANVFTTQSLSEQPVPSYILRSTMEVRKGFLSGIFASLGRVQDQDLIVASTPRKRLAMGIQSLLSSCGIESVYSEASILATITLKSLTAKKRFYSFANINMAAKYPDEDEKDANWVHTKVKSLTCNSEKGDTYDIEVEDNHQFFAGGYLVHNSAQIAIGASTDAEFLKAKRWDLGGIPTTRAYSNNTLFCEDVNDLPKEFWHPFENGGECYGLYNLRMTKEVGRTGDTRYPDPHVSVTNPCLTGDTLIQTTEGMKTIKSLVGKPFIAVIDGEEHKSTNTGFWSSGFKEVYAITLEAHTSIRATYNHRFMVNGEWTEVEDMDVGDTMHLDNGKTSVITGIAICAGEVEVFDCTIPDKHCFIANGMLSHNCAEISLQGTSENYPGRGGETCVTADTYILTDKGNVRIGSVVGQTVNVWNGEKFSPVVPFMASTSELFLIITFSDGSVLECTEYHEFAVKKTKDGREHYPTLKLRADQLSVGDEIPNFKFPGIDEKEAHPDAMKQGKSRLLTDDVMMMGNLTAVNYMGGWATSGRNSVISGTQEEMRKIQLIARNGGINTTEIQYSEEHDIYILAIGLDFDGFPNQRVVSIERSPLYKASYCFTEPERHMGVFNNVLTYQCCLAEIPLPRIDSRNQLYRVMSYLYRTCKHSLLLDCHHPGTKEIVHRNMRIGISVTGVMQATEEQLNWLPHAYEWLREFDRRYSAYLGVPVSVKLTTIKPSGTLSILAGVTPGVHPSYSEFYRRRVRFAADSPLLKDLEDAGYHIEYSRHTDGTDDKSTKIVSYPCRTPKGTVLAKDCTAIAQLETVKRMQAEWCDNSCSVTIYIRKEELPDIKKWLEDNWRDGLKTISFLLHSDHGFDQAPYEEITEDEFNEMSLLIRPIEQFACQLHSGIAHSDADAEALLSCDRGSCPIR